MEMKEADKETCLQQFHYQTRNFKNGEVIVYSQDPVIQQLILLDGIVSSEMSDYNGKTIKITDLLAPKILAPGFLFGSNNYYPVSLFAKTDCKLMIVSKECFIETVLKNRQLQINFYNIISNQTQFLSRKINFLNLKTIKAKIAYFLLNKYKQQKNINLKLAQSQTQLAELFGVTRPSLSRSINELVHDSIISIKGKNVTLINISKLKSYLR